MLCRSRTRRSFVIALVATAAAFFPGAAAGDVLRQQYASSRSPFWQVGQYNESLSDACRRREFGQIRQYRYTIGFYGDKGYGVVGIATKEWNLYDPKGLANSGFTYHFLGEGYSNCRVYMAKPKPRQGESAATRAAR